MTCSRNCLQLRSMLYKNWLLKKRRPFSTCFEILLPVLVMLIMVLIRAQVKKKNEEAVINVYSVNDPNPDGVQVDSSSQYFLEPNSFYTSMRSMMDSVSLDQHLALIPNNTMTHQFETDFTNAFLQASQGLPQQANLSFRYFKDDADLNSYVKDARYGFDAEHPGIYAAISFYKMGDNGVWDYAIRMNGSYNGGTVPRTDIPNTNPLKVVDPNQPPSWTLYSDSGFILLQNFVDNWIFVNSPNYPYGSWNFANGSIFADQMRYSYAPVPTPAYTSDDFADITAAILGLFFTIAYLWPVSRIIASIVLEKEKKIKEGMKMMGLTDLTFWLTWIITYIIINFITSILILISTKGSIYPNSDGGIIFLFFFVFQCSVFTLGVLISVFFNRAKPASSFGAIIFLGLYFAYFGVYTDATSKPGKTGACILTPACFGLGANAIAKLESSGQGVNYGNWGTEIDHFDAQTAIGMMWLDTLLYFFIAWYIEKVFPGEFGTPHPFYFIFMPSYWCPKRIETPPTTSGKEGVALDTTTPYTKHEEKEDDDKHDEKEEFGHSRYLEAVPKEISSRPGIHIKSIQKEFEVEDQVVHAVQGVTLDMYEGQITALLGHNGAGKSTLISMLTGLIPPTSGDAEVYGYSLNNEMEQIRESLGVCPQHDVLFDDLTVREHLELFARLKGTRGDLTQMVTEIVADIGLTEKIDARSSTLSGGQKRKLSIGIALIGNSKVIFLDECTSGMDVYSRRWIWNMLLKKKEKRVIILTTHFMDEADQLGDRIAIMAKGQLKCCGSSLFLKGLYGVGYTLTTSKADEASPDAVFDLIKSYVETAESLSQVGGELSFRLPFSATPKFQDMFGEFDKRKDLIKSYGIAVTTLEEVFLRVAKEEAVAKDEKAAVDLIRQNSMSKERKKDEPQGSEFDTMVFHRDGAGVTLRHFYALLIKRWYNSKRDKKQWVFQVILPLLITFAGLAALKWGGTPTQGSLNLSTGQYGNTPIWYDNVQGLPIDTAALFGSVHSGEAKPLVAPATVMSDVDMSLWLLNPASQVADIRYLAYQAASNFSSAGFSIPPTSTAAVTLLHNTTGTHALPIAFNFWHNLIYRNLSQNANGNIITRNYPLSETANQDTLGSLPGAIIIGIGFAFIPSSWVAFAVKEREINAKHQQLISGVSTFAYWSSTLVWDSINYLLPMIGACILIAAFNISALIGSNFGATFLCMLLYGPSIAAFTYLWSFAFKSHSGAQNTMILIYIMTGVLLAMASFILDLIDSTKDTNKSLKFLYRLLPNFCFGESLLNIMTREFSVDGVIKDLWDMDVVGWPCLYMTLEIFVYFGIVLLIEKIQASPAILTRFTPGQRITDAPFEDDVDVIAEKKLLQDDVNNELKDIVKVKGLRKEYGGLCAPVGKVAVKDIWFGIHEGECFAFLGINGAGKTTTMQMLTGAVYPTRGAATLKGYDIMNDQEQLRRHMGYCPQFDALIETLTGYETLALYARIKGVPENYLQNYVKSVVERIGLKEFAHRPCGGYSGGNKRKLSVGVALIGNPSIIFLDEPSTGMDPQAKRFMWELISSTMAGRSIILTTHSLEEAEALCQRIGIMVSGRLRCLGSAQHLRSRYGQGYQIEFKVEDSKEALENLRKWTESTFEGAQIVEIHGDHLKYKINRSLPLGAIFGEIERNKETLRIQEYSCAEFSLEQIFIYFAKQQEEEQAHVEGIHQDAVHAPVAPTYGSVEP